MTKLNSQQLIQRLLNYCWPYWPVAGLGILATLVFTSIDSIATYALKPLINEGFVGRNQDFIAWVPYILLGAFLLRGIANFCSSYCMAWVARKVVTEIRQTMFAHFQLLPATYYDQSSSGRLLSKLLYDVEQVAHISTDTLSNFLQSLFFVLGLLTVMVVISWRLSLLFFITMPIMVMVVRYTNKRVRMVSARVQKAMGRVTEVAEENVEGYKAVRIYGGQQAELNKFNQAINDSRHGDMKVVVAKGISVSGVQVIASFSIALIVYLAIDPSYSTVLTAGGFSSLILAMLALLKPLKNLTRINGDIQRGLAAARSVFEFLDSPPEVDEGQQTLTQCQGEIRYQHVKFAYNQDEWVLQDISFTVEPGQTIALVGRSGSGKSTIASLLARFYDPTHGEIYIDGIDSRQLTRASLRENIALVSQDVTLFNGTIRDNIAYGAPQASEAEIEAAARSAHALEFIHQFPAGMETMVGDNGVLLSGGQRQRIAIARAILKNAPILILDEATSALDSEAERHIQAALEAVMQNRTTLVIAHRLSTIEKANKILVIDHGQLVESGDHATLLAQGGHYARFHEMQFHHDLA